MIRLYGGDQTGSTSSSDGGSLIRLYDTPLKTAEQKKKEEEDKKRQEDALKAKQAAHGPAPVPVVEKPSTSGFGRGPLDPTAGKPKLGFIGRMTNKMYDTIVDTIDEAGTRLGDFLTIGMSTGVQPTKAEEAQNKSTSYKVGKAASAASGIIGATFLPITAPFAAGEEIPLVKYPVAGMNKVFSKVGEGGAYLGGQLVDSLPISDKAKENIKAPVQELTALAAQIAAGKAAHVGYKKITAVPTPETSPNFLSPREGKGKTGVLQSKIGEIRAKVISKTAAVQAEKGDVNAQDAQMIINEVAKEVPMKNPGTTSVPTRDGVVTVASNQKQVFDNFLKNKEDVTYKRVRSLGKDQQGNKVAARFEWDFKKQQATIYTTSKTTASNLAHEIGHYFDRKLSTQVGEQFSTLVKDYAKNKDAVQSSLAGYVVDRLGGEAKPRQISSTVRNLATKFNDQITSLASNETRGSYSEVFASAVREVLTNPKEAAKKAPEFTDFVRYFQKDQGLVADVVKKAKVKTPMAEEVSPLVESVSKFKTPQEFNDSLVQSNRGDFKTMQTDLPAETLIGEKKVQAFADEGFKISKTKVAQVEPVDVAYEVGTKSFTVLSDPKVVKDALASGAGRVPVRVAIVKNVLDNKFKVVDQVDYLKNPEEFFNQVKGNVETKTAKAVPNKSKSVDVSQEQQKPEIVATKQIPGEKVQTGVEPQKTSPEGKKVAEMGSKTGQFASTGLKTGKTVEGRPAFNMDKINAPEDVMTLIKGTSEAKGDFNKQRISKSDSDIKALAQEVNVSVDDLTKLKPGSIANAETIYKARQLHTELATDLRNTIRKITTENATPAELADFKVKLLRFMGTGKVIAGLRTEAANIFRQFKIESLAGENDIMTELLSTLKKVDGKSAGDLAAFMKGTKELVEPTFKDKAWHLWYMSMLSGESTQIKNFWGNAAQMLGEVAVEAVTNPKGFKNSMGGLYRGMVDGFGQFVKILKEGDRSKFEEKGMKPIKFTFGKEKATSKIGYATRAVPAAIFNSFDYVGRFMSGIDTWFRTGFKGWEMRAAARDLAVKEGLKGEALLERIDHLTNEPLTTMIEQADKFAARGTYTQQPKGVIGILSEGMGAMARNIPGGKFVIPFTRIVANVVNNSLDWTPIGFKRALLPSLFKGDLGRFEKFKFEKLEPRARNQALGRAALGTVAMVYFSSLAADGMLSGNGPSDFRKKEQMIASGWRPNSIKIGNKWYPYQNWGPLAIPMTLVGNYHDSYKYGDADNAVKRATVAVLGSVNSILDMSFLSGTADLVTAIQNYDQGGEKYFTRFAAQQLTSPVPNFYKQTARYFNTTTYKADTLDEMILSNLRITNSLKPKLNVFGEVVKGEALTQLQPASITKDPVISFLAKNELWVSVPSKATKIHPLYEVKYQVDGRPMTADEYYNYVKYSGIEIKKRIGQELPYIDQLPKDEKQDYIDKIVQEVRTQTKSGIELGDFTK